MSRFRFCLLYAVVLTGMTLWCWFMLDLIHPWYLREMR